jgi:acyl-CoA synthetase (AMP-forming)/AMP-acid ligase II
MDPGFWSLAGQATSMAGVPFIYVALDRLRIEWMGLPAMRTLTQAGGRLDPVLIERFRQRAEARGWRFFVMYGQTEATARIAYVPPDRLAAHVGAIGVAIPGGELGIDDGELVYRGPNVMMGYARGSADLSRGDELGGRLRTGDLGRVDADGLFWLDGRKSRLVKPAGLRVDLDELEERLRSATGCDLAAFGDDAQVTIATVGDAAAAERAALDLGLVPSVVRVVSVPAIPRSASGKVDGAALQALVQR